MQMKKNLVTPELIEELSGIVAEAEFVLIGAGAGMSVDAGVDFGEREHFLRRYPYLRPIGVHCAGHSIGFRWPTKSMGWAFYARHVHEVLFMPPANPDPYLHLKSITEHADRWVLTSNADELFARTGFEPDSIWTRQGTYARVQCLKPCSDFVWETAPIIERLLPLVDLGSGEFRDVSAVPRCPKCGGDLMLNVRGGDWFVEKPYESQQNNFLEWLGRAAKGRLVVIDIGSGFNTPSVIRWPCESIVARHPNAHLIRVNLDFPGTHTPLNDRCTSIAGRGADILEFLATPRLMPKTRLDPCVP
jgi:NAD-dependent SIR2 family protein deacetylase